MNALVVSAHPDDETLGCGGTLLKLRESGERLSWLIATESHQPRWSADEIECKRVEVERVAEAYEMERCIKLGFPAAHLDTVPQVDLIERIQDAISTVEPQRVFLVNEGDVHTDHTALFTATMSVLKAFHVGSLGVRQVLCYETLSSTEAAAPGLSRPFGPNVFSDVTPYIDRKIELMSLYQSELQPDPLPRGPTAIRALARYRGATIGVEYAEAFMLMRELM